MFFCLIAGAESPKEKRWKKFKTAFVIVQVAFAAAVAAKMVL